MRIAPSLKLPTPFGGQIELPPVETPPLRPLKAPAIEDARLIAHGVGEDAAGIFGIIPYFGSLLQDSLQDMHYAEIKKLLPADKFPIFTEYNKAFPSGIALARTLLFEEED